ncbi:MAG: helix-turn-helix transcriptional regulator, partial [Solirubrobacterales bacterium]|nr:helix-turn-helix transcriptional regulator [Solirubrobacterales bacterium]
MGAPNDTATAERSETDRGTSRSPSCCPLYHEAVELVGRRWTGAILRVLMDGALRFSEIAQAVPELSDRLLS